MSNIVKKLADAILNSKINISELSRKSKVSRQTIYNILNGAVSTVSFENVESLCNVLKLSSKEILDFPNNIYPLEQGVKIKVLGSIPAGIPIEAVEDVIGEIEISNSVASTGNYFALKVKGESMSPQILDGDIVVVKQQQNASNGDICVIMINGNEATLKKIKKDPNGISIIPNNPAFDVMYFSNYDIETLPIRILGKVVEIRRSVD